MMKTEIVKKAFLEKAPGGGSEHLVPLMGAPRGVVNIKGKVLNLFVNSWFN